MDGGTIRLFLLLVAANIVGFLFLLELPNLASRLVTATSLMVVGGAAFFLPRRESRITSMGFLLLYSSLFQIVALAVTPLLLAWR